MPLLTEREAAILRYIRRFIAGYECAPTLRDIANEFGFNPPRTVAGYLNALQSKGCIRWTPGLARSVKLPSNGSGPQLLANILGLTAEPDNEQSWVSDSFLACAATD